MLFRARKQIETGEYKYQEIQAEEEKAKQLFSEGWDIFPMDGENKLTKEEVCLLEHATNVSKDITVRVLATVEKKD